MRIKRQLADDAIYLERTLCCESGGVQDQIAASFGGLNRINFNADGYQVNPIIISESRKKELSDNLLLFFTAFQDFPRMFR
jgi:D-glycero-alpha-D-manno-heptose-7-phosphate kinase